LTCIVSLKDSGKVWLAADSCTTYDSHRDLTDDKLFRVGGFIVGGAGDVLLIQYVRHGLHIKPKGSLVTQAAKQIGPAIAEIWNNLQQLDEDIWAEFIFARGSEMVSISARGEVFSTSREYLVIGTGAPFAMGSLRNSRGKPEDRMIQAINTASEFLGDVCGPIRVVST
jgi:ATP-dependent protease HslVU (ClpYQ) peptidase subunit